MTEAIAAEAPAVIETPTAVVDAQNTAQAAETTDPAPVAQDEETTKPPETEEQRKSKFQRRIERKNADLAAAKTEARMLRERLDQLEAQRNPQVQRDQSAPTLDKFDNFEDYMAARVAYEAEKVVDGRLSKVQQMEAERKATEAQHRVLASWQEKQAAAADKYADFEEVVGDSEAAISREMGQAIVESDYGADIAYYLAQHPEDAKRIASLSPIRQIVEIGKLEDRVSKPAPKAITKAPEPITPAGSRAKADKNPSEMSPSEFAAWRKRVIARRR